MSSRPTCIVKTGPFEMTVNPQTPNPSLPYLIGSPLYQAVILPASYTVGSFEKTFPGTGPYKLAPNGYTVGVGAQFVRNTAYWGGTPALRHRPPHLLQRHGVADPGAAGR